MSEQRLREFLKRAVPEPPDLDAAAIERRAARERRNRMAVAASGAAMLAIVAGSAAIAGLTRDDGGQVPPSGRTQTVIPWTTSPPGPDPVPPGSVTPSLAGDGQVPPSGQTETVVPWAASPPGPDPVPPGSVTPPLAGEPIDLQLIVDEKARRGEPLKFIVRIANEGSEPVSLDPCPYYRVQYMPSVETGYLNCAQAPAAIPAKSYLDFAMQIQVPPLGDAPADLGGTHDLLWQLGGEGAEGETVTTPVELA